jgi:3',5'-cyclic AMP phosphodiesterase CpdA
MMNRLILKWSVWLLILSLGSACSERDPGMPPGDFRAIILADTHISSDRDKDGRLKTLVDRINRGDFPDAAFMIINGDCVSRVYKDYTEADPDTGENRVMKLKQMLEKLKIPTYLVMGNHDYKIGPDKDSDAWFSPEEIAGMERRWKRWTGFDPYYSFDVHGWRIIVLNSMRGRQLWRHFDEGQLDWLEKTLKPGMPTVLYTHFPLKTDHFRIWCKKKDLIRPEKESRFYAILKRHQADIKGIFTGHGHMWIRSRLFTTVQVFQTAAFGDAKGLPFHWAGFTGTTLTVVKKDASFSEE